MVDLILLLTVLGAFVIGTWVGAKFGGPEALWRKATRAGTAAKDAARRSMDEK